MNRIKAMKEKNSKKNIKQRNKKDKYKTIKQKNIQNANRTHLIKHHMKIIQLN